MLAGGATNAFSSLGTAQTALTSYDGRGHAVKRVLVSNGSQQTQTLSWDGAGRLTAVSQRDGTSGNGYDWTAHYDGLGRRLRTVYTPVDGGVACPKLSVTQASWYDPEVEFQELGVSVNGQGFWKLYGPDLNGGYGGLQGVGGLEAVIRQSDGAVTPLLSDAFGNVVASVTNGTSVVWNTTRVGGYGPLPGSSAQWLSTNTTLAAATVWRGKRMDPTGYYWMGARYYDPTGGRFLSPDPLGHDASMDLYSYADGDPINDCDPDGRFGKQAWNAAKHSYDSFASQFYSTPEAQFIGTSINAPSGWTPYAHGTTWYSDGIAQVANVLSLANNTAGNTLVAPVAQAFATAENMVDHTLGKGSWEFGATYAAMTPMGPEVTALRWLLGRASARIGTIARTEATLGSLTATEARRLTYNEMRQGGLNLTDRMSGSAFERLVKNIKQNGLENRVINYVEIGGENYVVLGNNRVKAARQLGITDQLVFQEVKLPFYNPSNGRLVFRTEDEVILAHAEIVGGN